MNSTETYAQENVGKASEKTAVVEVKDLHIGFGQQEVLKGVTFDLYRGENLVVLGKSGSGKSVTIKCIARLLVPNSGSIKVLGDEVTSLENKQLAEKRKKIGFLFQSGALYDSMTVRENLEFPLRRMRPDIAEEHVDAKVHEALSAVGLVNAMHKMPSGLSGGMRKRIALARTIIVDPEIMLYDEPTTGLDPITSDEISELINEVKLKYKTSSIIITHDMPCARKVADRVIMLKEGKIEAQGTLQEIEKKNDEWIQSFFGKSN